MSMEAVKTSILIAPGGIRTHTDHLGPTDFKSISSVSNQLENIAQVSSPISAGCAKDAPRHLSLPKPAKECA